MEHLCLGALGPFNQRIGRHVVLRAGGRWNWPSLANALPAKTFHGERGEVVAPCTTLSATDHRDAIGMNLLQRSCGSRWTGMSVPVVEQRFEGHAVAAV